MPVVLIIITDNNEEIELPILEKCTLGRSSRCDLTLNDRQMSAQHGHFELNKKGELIYTDLGSTNGSFLNNSKIQKIQFKVNETLRLGNTTISIDEKRLNTRELLTIGIGVSEKSGMTIPEGLPHPSESKPPVPPKKSVSLKKEIKKNTPEKSWIGGKNENVIEQEKSTGATKLLKLDINKHKKK